MNYKESALILKEIKKAKRILLNCHRGPDADSLGSALALYIVLRGMGKDVSIIYPRKSGLPSNLKFLPNFEKITPVDYANYDFSKHDLFVVTDSSSWDMVSNGKEIPIPKIPLIVIDHHLSNTRFGNINLVDSKVTSVGEFLYWIMTDWDVQVDKDIATCLLTGIIGDTGAFRFPGTGARTLEVAGKLMAKGADKEKIVFNIYSFSFGMIKFWAEALKKAKIDKIGKFLWMAIPHEKYVELGSLADAKEWTATQFGQIVDGTDFGIVMVEKERGKLSLSFRSRTGFDTSKIAVYFGGGGHIYASGGIVEGLPFGKAVRKVLSVARKYAKLDSKSK